MLFKRSYYVLGIKTLRLFDEFSISKKIIPFSVYDRKVLCGFVKSIES